MSEPIAPRSLVPQLVAIALLSAAVGYVALAAGPHDFTSLTEPLEAVDSGDLATLVSAPLDGPVPARSADGSDNAKVAAPNKVRMVAFMDIMTTLYGQSNVTFVDARDEPSFEQGHIPGAVPIDAELAETDRAYFSKRAAWVPTKNVLVVYCSGGDCDLSKRLAQQFIDAGYPNTFVFEGGWNEWVDEGAEKQSGVFTAPAAEVQP